jgi:alanyl aminopeptidase
MKSFAGVVFACLLSLPTLAAQDPLPVRLPSGVTPAAYQLSLTVDPNQPRHSGTVTIAVTVTQPGTVIRLNAAEIDVSSAVLEIAGKSFKAQARVRNSELMDLDFDTPFPAGKGDLKMVFTGRIEDKDSQGLFRQKEGGDWYAFTQFESISARRAFPGFDEPGWKVPWTLSLTIPQGMTAVASTPMAREVALENGQKRVEFQVTQPMPSYLLAFGVGPFDILDGGKAGSTPVRFITPRGRASEASFAASMTPDILARLETYFGTPYPYEKLDVMSLPMTLGFSAMENPGLVTFSSLNLLAKSGEESTEFKREFVSTQAHELAHMWFGNLVTMAWWDDLWLNESFASWMAEKITNQMSAEFRGESDTQGARAWAMQTDRLLSTSQIYQPVTSSFSQSDQDGGQHPAIVYGKGQVTLAMFETWLGADRFQAGVRRYMAKHAWGNATSEDFVAALVQGDVELSGAFRTFTHQPGIPRVVVALDCHAKPVLTLTQSRFLPQGVHAKDTPLWAVPVTVRTPAGTSQILLKTKTAQLNLPDASCPTWVQANASGSGYYRAVYAPGALRTLLMSADLSQPELLAGLNDAQALTESGDMPVAEALEMATHFAHHPQRKVAEAALSLIGRMDALIEPTDRTAYAALWQRSFGQRGRLLGLLEKPGDSPDDRLMRTSWVGRLADAGHDTTLRSEARLLAHNWLADRKSLAVNSRGLVLRTAALTGDRAFFDALVAAVAGNPDRHARADIYAALGNFRDPKLTKAARQLWLSPAHDIREVMATGRSGNTSAAREELFQFITGNFESLVAKMAQETTTRFPQMFAGACSERQAEQLESFFTPLLTRFDGMERTLRQSLEVVRLCANYRDAQQASLHNFISRFRPAL